jgi:hypothetical protein
MSSQTTKGRELISGELRLLLQRLIDSRIDTIGDNMKPKTLVETFWLNKVDEAING